MAMSAQQVFFAALDAHKKGALGQAEALYRRLLTDRSAEGNYPLILFNLGLALAGQDKVAEAIGCYQRALRLKPGYVDAAINLGALLRQEGRLEEAVVVCRAALRFDGRSHQALDNLASALKDLGRLEESLAVRREAMRLRPDDAVVLANLGNTLMDLGRLDDAARAYRQAIGLEPDRAELYHRLGDAAFAQVSLDQAVEAFRRAIRLVPGLTAAYHHLGRAFLQQGKDEAAAAALEQAAGLAPDDHAVRHDLGCALWAAKRWEEGLAALRLALALRPDDVAPHVELASFTACACAWDSTPAHAQAVLDAVRQGTVPVNPFAVLPLPSTAAEQLACARRWASQVAEGVVPFAPREMPAMGRIRVGYLSADYHSHPVTLLAVELFERHDRDRFEIVAYSTGPDDSGAFRDRLVGAFDRFVDLRPLSDGQAARLIRDEGIDILVDLTGYTAGGRSRILAYRPAPIQVNHLGFPGTMGAGFIDYVIGDAFLLPMDQQPFYAENIVHLPDCFQPADSRRAAAARPERAACGLPEAGLVFCAFNNSYKITPEVFTVWMRLLAARPGSVLWLADANAPLEGNLRRAAERRGIAPDRLVFSPRLPYADYLARLPLADLFLDTLPYNAGATASDALWGGLPLLTCSGKTYVGRMAGSLLTALGLPELIAATLDEYEAIALDLTESPETLIRLRAKLQARRLSASLFDTPRYTANLERAYARMCETYRAGRPPEPFAL